MPGGVRGGVKVSKGVKRGVPGVKGSLGDPRGLRGVFEVYQGLKESPGKYNKKSLTVKYIFLISQETNGRIMISKIVLKSVL